MAKKVKSISIKELNADPELKAMGARLQQLRRKKGYTSYETFANEHDIHRVQWGRYEQGKDLYFSSLVKACKILGVTLKEFFSEGFE